MSSGRTGRAAKPTAPSCAAHRSTLCTFLCTTSSSRTARMGHTAYACRARGSSSQTPLRGFTPSGPMAATWLRSPKTCKNPGVAPMTVMVRSSLRTLRWARSIPFQGVEWTAAPGPSPGPSWCPGPTASPSPPRAPRPAASRRLWCRASWPLAACCRGEPWSAEGPVGVCAPALVARAPRALAPPRAVPAGSFASSGLGPRLLLGPSRLCAGLLDLYSPPADMRSGP
mmetsp:Transcript_74381/g.240581  ORF Transcript_74381/g.240581 Transcript_74381/m.240581 type:complete len:227 (+) Transcript_74381:648-1328(+)